MGVEIKRSCESNVRNNDGSETILFNSFTVRISDYHYTAFMNIHRYYADKIGEPWTTKDTLERLIAYGIHRKDVEYPGGDF